MSMTIESFLFCVVFVALISAFMILLAAKLGIIEWLQVHGDKYISKMAQCYFCMSFWTGSLCFLALVIWFNEPLLIFGGVFSSPITRVML